MDTDSTGNEAETAPKIDTPGAQSVRGSVLQFEVDTKRFAQTRRADFVQGGTYGNSEPWGRLIAMACTAVRDTITNGGTFVLVMDGGKLTMVQRPDAEPL